MKESFISSWVPQEEPKKEHVKHYWKTYKVVRQWIQNGKEYDLPSEPQKFLYCSCGATKLFNFFKYTTKLNNHYDEYKEYSNGLIDYMREMKSKSIKNKTNEDGNSNVIYPKVIETICCNLCRKEETDCKCIKSVSKHKDIPLNNSKIFNENYPKPKWLFDRRDYYKHDSKSIRFN